MINLIIHKLIITQIIKFCNIIPTFSFVFCFTYSFYLNLFTISSKLSSKKSTSHFLLNSPIETRIALDASSFSRPIAVNTWEGPLLPELHAEPVETDIPFLSNYKRISKPSTPSKEILAFPGNLFSISPFIFIFGILFSTSSKK